VRQSEFWALIDAEFGPGQGRALVRDHVLAALGHRTAAQAMEGGEPLRQVWLVLCEDLGVPPERRWGADDGKARRAGRRR
jgi:hypothetical protein